MILSSKKIRNKKPSENQKNQYKQYNEHWMPLLNTPSRYIHDWLLY